VSDSNLSREIQIKIVPLSSFHLVLICKFDKFGDLRDLKNWGFLNNSFPSDFVFLVWNWFEE